MRAYKRSLLEPKTATVAVPGAAVTLRKIYGPEQKRKQREDDKPADNPPKMREVKLAMTTKQVSDFKRRATKLLELFPGQTIEAVVLMALNAMLEREVSNEPKSFHLTSSLPEEWVASQKGHSVDSRHFTKLFAGEPMDVYKPDGSPLLLYRPGAIAADVCERALEGSQGASPAQRSSQLLGEQCD